MQFRVRPKGNKWNALRRQYLKWIVIDTFNTEKEAQDCVNFYAQMSGFINANTNTKLSES